MRRLGGSRWRLRRTRCAMGLERQGGSQDRDVGVGVPEGEEVFVSGERPNAGGIGIHTLNARLQGIGTSHSQMRTRDNYSSAARTSRSRGAGILKERGQPRSCESGQQRRVQRRRSFAAEHRLRRLISGRNSNG